ncbi:MAG: acetylxylan esterase [Clostridia bacterium]|nr:acetylxylan esterase [Clostridia bacterium]MBQ4156888.1 acetylxylan esterase [Clostridia bacterium]
MPMLDMPLEKLREYKGVNPKPADFDEYWDRAIREMEALGTGCTLTPASFQVPGAECFDLTFIGVGGAKVYAQYVRPKNRNGKCPALLQFHGYSGNRGDFSGKLNYVCMGFCVAALDARGQGGKSEDNLRVQGNTLHGQIIRGLEDENPDKLYFRNVFLDTAQLARIVMAMEEVDETKVGATGGSQGGALTLACAALTPNLNRCAPKMSFLCDYKRVWDMDLDKDAYSELKEYFRRFDPRHEKETEVFTKLGYIDNLNLAPRIRCKVLHFTGLLDSICPPSTQFAAYNAITAEKGMVLYPDFGHENYPEADDITMKFMAEMI